MNNTIKYKGKLNAIGKVIKDYRLQNQMTQKELAERLQLYGIDINKNSLQKVERGDRIIKEYELAVFSIIFKVFTDELLKKCIEDYINEIGK